MMSASLGIVLLGAAVAVLLAAGRMRRNQQLLSDANDESRAAMRVITRGIAATGVGGKSYTYAQSGTPAIKRERASVLFMNGTQPLKAGSMPQTPDALVIMRYAADRRSDLVAKLGGSKVSITPDPRLPTTPGFERDVFLKGESALITNFQRSMLLPVNAKSLNGGKKVVEVDVGVIDPKNLQDVPTIDVGSSVFPVQLVLYRVVYVPAKGGQPERADLVAETLDPGTLAVRNQAVLARDIEDFQVQWAYDYNEDGLIDGTYSNDAPPGTSISVTSAGAITELAPASLATPYLTYARVSISARTSTKLIGDKGEFISKGEQTPFELGLDLGVDASTRPLPSGYRRRVLSTVVLLKNLAAPRI